MLIERHELAERFWRELLGVNDIGVATSESVAQSLISAYEELVSAARGRGVRIYGVPILRSAGRTTIRRFAKARARR